MVQTDSPLRLGVPFTVRNDERASNPTVAPLLTIPSKRNFLASPPRPL